LDKQNWAAKLLGYQFDIVYQPDLDNQGAKVSSRMYDVGDSPVSSQEKVFMAMVYTIWSD
jgi:hypothetical protein